MSFEQAYEEFKIYAKSRHKKQYFDTITQNFKLYVLPYFLNKNLEDLSVKDIVSWQDFILKHNFSNNYNKNLYCAFNSFLKYCVLNCYVSTNYLSLVGSFKKKIECKEHCTYSYIEYKLFRKGIKNIVYKFFFDFLFFYGARSGEAMALKFSDLNNSFVHLGTSIQRGGKRLLDSPKTIKSNRYIKINFIMKFRIFILRCYYIKIYGVFSNDYFIFGGQKPLSPTSIKRYKHAACVNRGLKEITIHEFRHSCATRIFIKLLGHSSISITLDIYTHVEKKKVKTFFPQLDFFNTITQNFKKILQYIITRIV